MGAIRRVGALATLQETRRDRAGIYASPHGDGLRGRPRTAGGGAVAATVTYGVLRRKGFDPEKIGLVLAVVSVLVYGTLGVLFAGVHLRSFLQQMPDDTSFQSLAMGRAKGLARSSGKRGETPL